MSKQRSNIIILWSPDLAYIIGLISSDGNLSKDKRHICFCSKDIELIRIVKEILQIDNKIGRFSRKNKSIKKYYRIQFGSVLFYKFLNSIGLHENKSKSIEKVDIPSEYFPDFLRGLIDGDGNICLFKHKESKHIQIKIRIASASILFLQNILRTLKDNFGFNKGWMTKSMKNNNPIYSLCFGKKDSLKIINLVYYDTHIPFLKRKYVQAKKGQMAELARRASLRS